MTETAGFVEVHWRCLRGPSKARNMTNPWDIAFIGGDSIRRGMPIRRRVTTHRDTVNALKYTKDWN